jgi:hypothetical protein
MIYEEALAGFREVGSQHGSARVLINLAGLALRDEEADRASSLLQEALALSEQGGHREGVAHALAGLGEVALLHGHAERAMSLLRQSLKLHWEMGNRPAATTVLPSLAGAAISAGHLRQGATLWGIASQIPYAGWSATAEAGQPGNPWISPDGTCPIDDAASRTAWDRGRAMTLEEAVAYALANSNQ